MHVWHFAPAGIKKKQKKDAVAMTKEELMKYLPHRDNMLLIGEASILEDEEGIPVAVGHTRIRGDEWFLQGHFPGNPVVPGVILCEIMAQSVCVLIRKENTTPYFTGMNNVKWKRMVKPGDVLVTECKIVRNRSHFYWAKGVGKVNGELCVSAEFSFAMMESESNEI